MNETSTHPGGCRCGQVRFEACAEPHHVSYCHCGDCRRATGAPVSAFVGFRTKDVAFTGKDPKTFDNGPATRGFCAACGSPLFYVDARLPGEIYFMLGAMDRPAYFKPTLHAYVREQLPFVHMPDGLPRHLKSSVPRQDDQAEPNRSKPG